MTKKPNRAVRQAGVVTFLDVLGWKGVYDRKDNAVASLRLLVKGVTDRAEKMRGRINSEVIVRSISDTIAIFTFCEDDKVTKTIEIHGELCQWLIPESILSGLPMRGATSYGDFEISESIFVGRAVDEAASWHEQGNWIGVNLSPSAEFVFSKTGTSAWVPYAAPLKVSMKWQPHCVNWITNSLGIEEWEGKVRSKFLSMGPILPEIAPKFINTLEFMKEMTKKLTPPQPIPPSSNLS